MTGYKFYQIKSYRGYDIYFKKPEGEEQSYIAYERAGIDPVARAPGLRELKNKLDTLIDYGTLLGEE